MSEITFTADKKHRDKYFNAGSFAHPAKMILPLQRWLIEKYTKPGDVILDPMGGCGTVLIACTMGRNVITVELEVKFIRMQNDNWTKIQTLGPEMGHLMGTATILQGDARNLPDVLADVVISSPPYNAEPTASKKYLKIRAEMGRDITKPSQQYAKYSADVIWTSPSYEASVSDNKEGPGAGGNEKNYGRWAKSTAKKISYTQDETCKVDAVITSPPYEAQIHPTHETTENVIATNDPKHLGQYSQPMLVNGYGATAENIGNLKGKSYLSAMLEVYQGCWRVLKSQGLMCLVTKNFIRNKQEIRLDLDTIKLCEQAGFELIERHYRKLINQSFWRAIYQQKYPDAPVLDREDILVFRKVQIPMELKI